MLLVFSVVQLTEVNFKLQYHWCISSATLQHNTRAGARYVFMLITKRLRLEKSDPRIEILMRPFLTLDYWEGVWLQENLVWFS